MVGPWALAITVATDGAFWGAAVGGDLAPKLIGGQEGHGAPPGFYALLAPAAAFPAALCCRPRPSTAWRAARRAGVRFALCWLVPAWLVFELAPTKLVHYTLPLYGALAWLMARGADRGRSAGGARWVGAALVLASASPLPSPPPGRRRGALGDARSAGLGAVAAALFLAAGAAGGGCLLRARRAGGGRRRGLGVLGHGVLAGARRARRCARCGSPAAPPRPWPPPASAPGRA